MSENCKDCVQVQNLKDDMKRLSDDFERLRNDIKDIYDRLSVVEKFSASGGEQIKMIFKILSEIKDSIKDISTTLSILREKPAGNAEKLKWIITTALVSSLAGAVVGFIIK